MFKHLFAKTGLSLDRLQNFCRVARVESFTRAADGDPNRQTLYSRQVKELEQYFGTPLFHRRGRTVALTEKGRELYFLVSEYFNALEDYLERCGSELATYVIGAGDSVIQWSLLPRLPELRECLGRADLVFKNLRSSEIIQSIERGELDFGIVRDSALNQKVDGLSLGRLDFSLFCPAEQFQGRDQNNADMLFLDSIELAGMEGRGFYQERLEQLAAAANARLRFAVTCSSFPMMAQAIRKLGLSAVLPTIAEEEFDTSRFVSVKIPELAELGRSLVLCWNRRMAALDESVMKRADSISRIVGFKA